MEAGDPLLPTNRIGHRVSGVRHRVQGVRQKKYYPFVDLVFFLVSVSRVIPLEILLRYS
jgi:hypothetical protein